MSGRAGGEGSFKVLKYYLYKLCVNLNIYLSKGPCKGSKIHLLL